MTEEARDYVLSFDEGHSEHSSRYASLYEMEMLFKIEKPLTWVSKNKMSYYSALLWALVVLAIQSTIPHTSFCDEEHIITRWLQ